MMRHVSVFGSLASMYMYQHPRAVDVADLQVQPFPETQAERADRPEIRRIGSAPVKPPRFAPGWIRLLPKRIRVW